MEYLSSPQQLEDFQKSSIYTDFMNEINFRIEALRDLMEVEGYTDNNQTFHAYKGSDYDKFRGGIRNMREMKTIFNDIIEIIIADREAEEVPE